MNAHVVLKHNKQCTPEHVLWLVKDKKHVSIDMLEIEMTCITTQLKYYKLQPKYMENMNP